MRMRFTTIGIAVLGLSAVLAACSPTAPATPTVVPTKPAATSTSVVVSVPTAAPTATPTVAPTAMPTAAPTVAPTKPAATAVATSSADLALGKTVFAANCDVCHPGGAKGVGPAIKGTSVDKVIKQVRQGGGAMPAFGPDKISDVQLNALAAYVASLQ